MIRIKIMQRAQCTTGIIGMSHDAITSAKSRPRIKPADRHYSACWLVNNILIFMQDVAAMVGFIRPLIPTQGKNIVNLKELCPRGWLFSAVFLQNLAHERRYFWLIFPSTIYYYYLCAITLSA
jgi:hypothetical protein